MRSERAELAALAAETLRHGTWNEPQALTSEKVLLQCDSKSYWPAAVAKIADFLFKFDESADKSMKSIHFLIGISTISAPF